MCCACVCVERVYMYTLYACVCTFIYQAAKGAAAKGGAAQGVGAKGAAAKGGARAKKAQEALEAPPKKAEATPAELEEEQYLLEHGTEPLAADPWAAHRSPYGGSLSPGTPPTYLRLLPNQARSVCLRDRRWPCVLQKMAAALKRHTNYGVGRRHGNV